MSDMTQMQVLHEETVPIQLSTLFIWTDKINPKHSIFIILSVTIIPNYSSWSAFVPELQELGFRRSSRNMLAGVSGIFQAATQTSTALKFERDIKSRCITISSANNTVSSNK